MKLLPFLGAILSAFALRCYGGPDGKEPNVALCEVGQARPPTTQCRPPSHAKATEGELSCHLGRRSLREGGASRSYDPEDDTDHLATRSE